VRILASWISHNQPETRSFRHLLGEDSKKEISEPLVASRRKLSTAIFDPVICSWRTRSLKPELTGQAIVQTGRAHRDDSELSKAGPSRSLVLPRPKKELIFVLLCRGCGRSNLGPFSVDATQRMQRITGDADQAFRMFCLSL
jgi:hypothetical protein